MELLDRCRDYADKFFRELMLAAEKTLDAELFESAKSSDSNEDQQRFYETIQGLKQHGPAMHTAFQKTMADNYQRFISGEDIERGIDEQIDMAALSLVQRDQLEDDLAISVIVSKSNSRNSECLWKLNKRLAVLRRGKSVSDETNPFGPARACEALQQAIGQLQVDGKTRIYLYKHFGKLYVVNFNKVLQGLNDLLVAKSILPNLRFSLAKAEAEASAVDSTVDETVDRERLAAEQQASIAHQQHLYQSIRDMQLSQGPKSHTISGVSFDGIATDSSGGTDAFAPVDYALALSAIQQSQEFLSAAALGQPLKTELVEKRLFKQLNQVADKKHHHKMTRDDADTVDLVGMIFRYMLDDDNLHDAVKSLLSHLHTPYLKLALMDKSFLEEYQHSARLLLNGMAEVGGRWVRDDGDRIVIPKIKTIVETVLKGFVDDVTIFDRLLEDFTRFKQNLEKRASMVEKRNTESQQGMERLEVSKQQAADELESRMDSKALADKVRDVLRKPWSDFLSYSLLRHGDDSLSWKSALKVVDAVVWSMTVLDGRDEDKNRHHQQEIEQTVKQGLETIAYDVEGSKSLLNSLKEAHKLVHQQKVLDAVSQLNLSGEADAVAEPAIASLPAGKPNASPVKKPVELKTFLTAEEEKALGRLKAVDFGTWFEFTRPENLVEKLKLAWFSQVSLRYMFVDHAGVKQAVETRVELAKGMSAGLVSIVELDNKSFMERALEAVFSRLKIGTGSAA